MLEQATFDCKAQSGDVVARLRGFRLESGQTLAEDVVRGRLHGAPDAPVLVVLGGISSDRFAHAQDDGRPGWWRGVVETGGPVDPSDWQVLGVDFAPSSSETPLTFTTRDQARLLALVLDAAAIDTVHAIVGASYGGMVALAFAELFPDRVERLCLICAAHRAHPMATAWRGVQRRILAFAQEVGQVEQGVALARELAMTTYRAPEEFARRFERTPPSEAGEPYPVCDYLIARGREYPARMDANRWIALSDSMDRHWVRPEAVATPTTVVGFTSDRLVPAGDLRELAQRLPRLQDAFELESIYGHDGFLKETEQLEPILRRFLSTPAVVRRPQPFSRPRLAPHPEPCA